MSVDRISNRHWILDPIIIFLNIFCFLSFFVGFFGHRMVYRYFLKIPKAQACIGLFLLTPGNDK